MKHENVSSPLPSAPNGLEKLVLITAGGSTFQGIGFGPAPLSGVSSHALCQRIYYELWQFIASFKRKYYTQKVCSLPGLLKATLL